MQVKLPSERFFGKFEAVFLFYGAMPTGVTVSETGRIFICFPKWGMTLNLRWLRSLTAH